MGPTNRLPTTLVLVLLVPIAWALLSPQPEWIQKYKDFWEEEQIHDTDPDTFRNVTCMLTNVQSELIISKGYPVEEYEVQTPDGYILGLQRIPHGLSNGKTPASPRPVVFLHHGLLSASHDWVINFPNQSLGFILADKGYDVWLGNARGNTYSRKHVKLSPKSDEFWKFTWDDMALTDLPTAIDFILNSTDQKQLSYVGHSMGTSIIFALLSESPEYNEKVRVAVALGPVATVSFMTSPIRYIAPFSTDIAILLKLFGHGEFLPSNALVKVLSQIICKEKRERPICDNILFLLCGIESNQLNETRENVYIAHTPSGTSVYTVIHYAQMINSANFQKYDFGEKGNLNKYGQPTPPEYVLEKITSPIALMWGLNDPLADPTDVNLLALRLKNLKLSYQVPFPQWTHLDFVYGLDANTLLYPKVLSVLQGQ